MAFFSFAAMFIAAKEIFSSLLDMDHRALKNMGTKWPVKSLESFIDKDLNMETNLVEVIAKRQA